MNLSAKAARRVAATCLVLALALTLWGVLNHRNLRFDFANFYDAGQRAAAGEFATLYDATAPIAGHEPYGGMSFYSAPLTSYLFVPMAGLHPRTATVIFKALGAAAQVLALWLLWRRAARLSPDDERSRALFAALAAATVLAFQPIYAWMFVGGQTTPFVFLGLVLGWIAFLGERQVLAALALSAVVVVKPAFAPMALLVFLCAPWRFRVAALAMGIGFLGLSVAILGVEVHKAFLNLILSKSADVNAPWQNANPFSWVEPLLPGASGGAAVRALQLAGVAVLAWLLAGQLRAGLPAPARRHAVWSAGILAALTLSPVVWSHYLIALLIPALPLIASRQILPRGAGAVWVPLMAVSVVQNKLVMGKIDDSLSFEHLPSLVAVGLVKSMPMLIALTVAVLWRQAIRRALADPAWLALGDASDRNPGR